MDTTTMTTDLDNTLKNLGGICKNYMAGTVAWNDNKRSANNGKITSFGSDITDARIVSKNGKHMPFVKPHNLTDKLGVTTAEKINFVRKDGTSTTAQEILENLSEYSKYVGYKNVDAKVTKQQPVVVRVQCTFVPISDGETCHKIAPGHYSYQTMDPSDPCNCIITGTSQGIFVHNDDVGINNLYAHTINDDGSVNNHWFEACPTDHSVGGIQVEDEYNIDQKKAKVMNIGFEKMGKSCNTFLVMSFQREKRPFTFNLRGENCFCDDGPVYRSFGTSSAARMSIDEDVVGLRKATELDMFRLDDAPIVLTILKYYAVKAPKGSNAVTVDPTDVALAVGDMENIYKMCDSTGLISELPVMMEQLTRKTVDEIMKKVVSDPPILENLYTFTPDAVNYF